MHSLISRWRMLALFLPIAAVVALVVVFGGNMLSGSSAEAVDDVQPGEVTCGDLWLDFPPFQTKGTAPGNNDLLSAKTINRVEELQPPVAGQFRVLTASYIGPDIDGNVIPDKPPAAACQDKATAAAGGAEADVLNEHLNFANLYSDDRGTIGTQVTESFDYSASEDGAGPGTCLNGGIDDGPDGLADFDDPDCYVVGNALTYTTCTESAALNSWVRIDVNADTKEVGGKAYGQVILFTDAASPTVPNDPTTCDVTGAQLYVNAFPNVLVSSARDATTDESGPKETAYLIPADPSGTSGPDTADGLADDWDGDGCPDWDELDKDFSHGSDPFNPNDCDQIWSSEVSILAVALGAGNSGGQAKGTPGAYFHCRGESQDDAGTIALRLLCYVDNPGIPVNSLLAADCTDPADCGDGYPGTPPPETDDPHTDDGPFVSVLSTSTHTELAGTVVKNETCLTDDANLAGAGGGETVSFVDGGPCVQVSGCFEDVQGVLGPNVYVKGNFHAENGAGYTDIWIMRADCTDPGAATPAFDHAYTQVTEQAKKPSAGEGTWDPDGDSCSTKNELSDDPTVGGRRDPYNPYDFYDVNGDGQVSLTLDILPVLVRWSPNPSQPYNVIYDRGATLPMSNSWNKQAPDGQISLTFDILGVILQWLHNCGNPVP